MSTEPSDESSKYPADAVATMLSEGPTRQRPDDLFSKLVTEPEVPSWLEELKRRRQMSTEPSDESSKYPADAVATMLSEGPTRQRPDDLFSKLVTEPEVPSWLEELKRRRQMSTEPSDESSKYPADAVATMLSEGPTRQRPDDLFSKLASDVHGALRREQQISR
ncbi:hypothetical protein GUITHDRAFT_122645 [Guillardia theta CCMP2712]|uniref:Uncharacterized protein n=1 Tax=Guillardia theta (strain CCMP2712) TaxID=905079 RepID=L1I5L6_GUITC|nr:hypothetical protein GUITHDRAFT_122645 [Guillardia theta CCMP2712]EKX31150.1 hypothetical protein GUITHDRAFT_122645 [Guillardia theta CCMP2712]|eukprot:XP_005818130.1 hypothetical protein GUITHDRAFT_122645 [Guillardia theta CCMP2712]